MGMIRDLVRIALADPGCQKMLAHSAADLVNRGFLQPFIKSCNYPFDKLVWVNENICRCTRCGRMLRKV